VQGPGAPAKGTGGKGGRERAKGRAWGMGRKQGRSVDSVALIAREKNKSRPVGSNRSRRRFHPDPSLVPRWPLLSVCTSVVASSVQSCPGRRAYSKQGVFVGEKVVAAFSVAMDAGYIIHAALLIASTAAWVNCLFVVQR